MKIQKSVAIAIDTKALGDDGRFEGYASQFGTPDEARDIVMKGAFVPSLAVRPATKVKMLRQHDVARPIGVWTDIVEDSKGLHVKGQILLDVQDARETFALMKAGALDGLSIGYQAKRATHDAKSGFRHLHEIDLWEISVVTFPAHHEARVTAVKHDDDPARARALVDFLNRANDALRSFAK